MTIEYDDSATTDVGNEASKPELETITINNRQVTVPKDVANVVKEMEHDLKSGYDKILDKERAELTKKENAIRDSLNEDLSWYSAHPKEAWGKYDSKVLGGHGFTGSEEDLKATPQQATVSAPQNNTSFSDSTKVSTLEREIEELKKKMTTSEEVNFKRGEGDVVEARDTLLRKYPNADIDSVNDGLRNYFLTKGEHPNKIEVEKIIRKRHDTVSQIIQKSKEPPKAPIPPVRESTPIKKLEKVPRIDDIDGVVKMMTE